MNAPLPRWAVVLLALAGGAAFLALPWFALPAGAPAWEGLGTVLADPARAAGAFQALLFRQPGWWAAACALVVALGAAAFPRSRHGGKWLLAAGFGGALLLLAYAFTGPAAARSLGWGAGVVLAILLALGAFGLARGRGAFGGDLFATTLAVFAAAVLLLFVGWPLARGLGMAWRGEDAAFSTASFLARVGTERVALLATNTLLLATTTATVTTVLGTLLALAELRSGWRPARFIRLLAPLPFVAPPFIAAAALILLFGRSGVASQALEYAFGVEAGRALYGWPGIAAAQWIAFTPIAYLIVRSALAGLDPSLEDAARTMNAPPAQVLRRVTLPLLAPALAHAFLVGFLESMGDFGTPLLVGGHVGVLSTEIFYVIVGAQFDGGRAAALGSVLAVFALVVFGLQRMVLRTPGIAAPQPRGTGAPPPLPPMWRRSCLAVAGGWLVLTLCLYGIAMGAAFVEAWGHDFRPTLRHLVQAFGVASDGGRWVLTGSAWASLLTSLRLAAAAAVLGTVASVLLAWLLERTRFAGQRAIEITALMALAVPGTVLGLCFFLAFNAPPLDIAGSGSLIVLCLVFRHLPVGVGIGTTAFRRVDASLEEASRVLGASRARGLCGIALPLVRPAIAGTLVYGFVRGMTTVSAVIFLITAETDLATTFIIARAGQSDYGVAFAYSLVLVLLLSLFMAAAWRLGAGVRLGRAMRPSHLAGMPA
jgi:iron(III) transport system permease protein